MSAFLLLTAFQCGSGWDNDDILAKWDMIDEICEKGYRNHPLTEEQKESNRKKSSIRSRVEHVFGFEEG